MLYLQNSAGRTSENLRVLIEKTTDLKITEDGSLNTILHLFALYGLECEIDVVIKESDVNALNENKMRPIDNVRNVTGRYLGSRLGVRVKVRVRYSVLLGFRYRVRLH
eukprot:sb/3477620/